VYIGVAEPYHLDVRLRLQEGKMTRDAASAPASILWLILCTSNKFVYFLCGTGTGSDNKYDAAPASQHWCSTQFFFY
jgi:hypothetical protein